MSYSGPITRARANNSSNRMPSHGVASSGLFRAPPSYILRNILSQRSRTLQAQAAEEPFNGPITRARARRITAAVNANIAANEEFLLQLRSMRSTYSPPGSFQNITLSSSTSYRLMKELREMESNPPEMCTAKLIDDSYLLKWEATILGPPGSIYENGVFKLHVSLTPEYPYKPPWIRFKTQVFHCNISRGGLVCMDVLEKRWSPALTISKILLSIQSLLTDPFPENPLNADASRIYLKNRLLHDEIARAWVRRYATPRIEDGTA